MYLLLASLQTAKKKAPLMCEALNFNLGKNAMPCYDCDGAAFEAPSLLFGELARESDQNAHQFLRV